MRHYIQECHEEALYTSKICAVYDCIKTSYVSLVQSQIINESSLSTGKVVAHLTLNKGDSKFLAFRKEVDTVMPKAINKCYGKFSYYTVIFANSKNPGESC